MLERDGRTPRDDRSCAEELTTGAEAKWVAAGDVYSTTTGSQAKTWRWHLNDDAPTVVVFGGQLAGPYRALSILHAGSRPHAILTVTEDGLAWKEAQPLQLLACP